VLRQPGDQRVRQRSIWHFVRNFLRLFRRLFGDL
jgi:hypothetical protein